MTLTTDLTDAALALVARMVAHESVCLAEADAGEAAAELVSAELAEWWGRPDGRFLVFTPLGRRRARAVMRERRTRVEATETVRGEPVTFHASAIDLRWLEVDDPESDLFTRGDEAPAVRYGREVPLPYPDRVPDPRAPKPVELAMDEVSGEPVKLWGMTVPVDPRLLRRGARRRGKPARKYAGGRK